MKSINKFVVMMLFLLFIVPYVSAIGISPVEKEVILPLNEPGVAFFSISTASKEISVEMSSNVDWLEFEPKTFTLSPYSNKYIQVKIKVLPEGNYSAAIIASYFTPGTIAMKTYISGTLHVSVLPPESIPEVRERLKKDAEDAIKKAEDMINEARKAGADVTYEEGLLARAYEAFANEKYRDAKEFADVAYNSALKKLDEIKEKAKKPLLSIEFGLLIIIFGAIITIGVLVFETYKTVKKKKEIGKLPIEKGIKCPSCGKDMAIAYKGAMIIGYLCPNCKRTEIKEKTTAQK